MNKRVFANIYMIVSVVLGFIFSVLAAIVLQEAEKTAFSTNLTNMLNSIVVLGIPVLFFGARNQDVGKEFFVKIPRKLALKYLLVVPVLWSSGNYFNSIICSSIARFGIFPIEQIPQSTEITAIICGFVFSSIVAPVLEELFYRGVILHLLKGYGTFCAITVSAVMFACAHGSVTVFGLPLVYGLVFGYATVKTGSLMPAIIMHMAANVLSWLFIAFKPAVEVTSVLNVIVIILGAGGLVWALVKLFRKKELIIKTAGEVWEYIKNPLWLPILVNYVLTNLIFHG